MKFEKGKQVPLTGEEKVRLAINYLCRDLGNEEKMAYWARTIVIESTNSVKVDCGERITAKGTFVLNRRRLSGNGVGLSPLEKRFVITVEDTKCEWGLQDVKVVEGKVTDKK